MSRVTPKVRLAACLVLLLSSFLTHGVQAWKHWFSGPVDDPEYPPPGSLLQQTNDAAQNAALDSMNSRLFDLTISLHRNPQGDDDGSTQGNPGSEDQDVIETIVQFMADGIFEATEGALKLRRVRIYRNSARHSVADILWDASGHPAAHINGISDSGFHIFMFDEFRGGGAGGSNYDLLADPIGAGYTLAHEFGHYALGLYDEYVLQTGDVPVVPSIMNNQWRARNSIDQSLVNPAYLQFSIKNQGESPLADFRIHS